MFRPRTDGARRASIGAAAFRDKGLTIEVRLVSEWLLQTCGDNLARGAAGASDREGSHEPASPPVTRAPEDLHDVIAGSKPAAATARA